MNFYIKRILPKPLRSRNSDKNETHRHTHGPREHYDDTVVIYVMIHWFYMNIKKTCHSIEKKGETKTFCNSYFVLNTFLGILSDLCCPFQSHFPDSRSRMTLFMFVRFGIQAINLFKKKRTTTTTHGTTYSSAPSDHHFTCSSIFPVYQSQHSCSNR